MKEKSTKNKFDFEGAKPVGDKFKGAKIAKTFRIDMDVFLWLRSEADRTGIPYQTLLNAKLREAMQAPTLDQLVEQKVKAALERKKAS